MDTAKALAVDPPGCGCTECMTGEYVPMQDATPRHMRMMLWGYLADHTGEQFTYQDGVLTANYSGHRWVLHRAA